MGILLRRAEVNGALVDVRVDGETITEIGPNLSSERRDEVVDAGGGALFPGLHDHHLHLLALAAAEQSVPVGPPSVTDRSTFATALHDADATLPVGRWIRAVGYHERAAGDVDRNMLDTIVPGRPVRVQHRSGALWMLNSAALHAIGLAGPSDHAVDGVELDDDGHATGRLWRLDGWLRDRVPNEPVDLRTTSRRLLRHGVTGVTDATPFEDAESLRYLARAVDEGDVAQRVMVTGGPDLRWDEPSSLERGPVKLLYADHEPVSFDAILAGIRQARTQNRPVAIHAVTASTVALIVAAIEELGARPGDRVEHGALVPLGLAARLADFGVTVVTNPGFVAARGDSYLADVDPHELPDLWRCRSLLDLGVSVAAGTDAPYGDANPWVAIDAAARRRTSSGAELGPDEAVSASTALGFFLSSAHDPGGVSRSVRVGARGDLCLLRERLADALPDPISVQPACTIVRGELSVW